MPTVVETIPEEIQAEVDAAVAWLNHERGHRFSVTGIVDPDEIRARRNGGALELGLVLCDGDLCVRENVSVRATPTGFDVSLPANATSEDPPAEVDPLPGVRKDWLAAQLARHTFVVLVFYRGFW
jgi:hypothetical protein